MTIRSSWPITRSSSILKERNQMIRHRGISIRTIYVILAKSTCKAIGRFSRPPQSHSIHNSKNGPTTTLFSFVCSSAKTHPDSVSLEWPKDTRSDGSWKNSNFPSLLDRLQSLRPAMICKPSSVATHLTISNGQTNRVCTNAPMSWQASSPTDRFIWIERRKLFTSHGEDL